MSTTNGDHILCVQQTAQQSWIDAGYLQALLSETPLEVNGQLRRIEERHAFRGRFQLLAIESAMPVTDLSTLAGLASFQRNGLHVPYERSWTVRTHHFEAMDDDHSFISIGGGLNITNWGRAHHLNFPQHQTALRAMFETPNLPAARLLLTNSNLSEIKHQLPTNTTSGIQHLYIGRDQSKHIAAIIIDTCNLERPIEVNGLTRHRERIRGPATSLQEAGQQGMATTTMKYLEAGTEVSLRREDYLALLVHGYPFQLTADSIDPRQDPEHPDGEYVNLKTLT